MSLSDLMLIKESEGNSLVLSVDISDNFLSLVNILVGFLNEDDNLK